jgi:hypothetical protein
MNVACNELDHYHFCKLCYVRAMKPFSHTIMFSELRHCETERCKSHAIGQFVFRIRGVSLFVGGLFLHA